MKKSVAVLLVFASILLIGMLGVFLPLPLEGVLQYVVRIVSIVLIYLGSLFLIFISGDIRKIPLLVFAYIGQALVLAGSFAFIFFLCFTTSMGGYGLVSVDKTTAIAIFVILIIHAACSLTVGIIFNLKKHSVLSLAFGIVFSPVVVCYYIYKAIEGILENIQDEDLKDELIVDILFLICALPLGLIMVHFTLRKIRIKKHPELDDDVANYVTYEGDNGTTIEIDTITGNGDDGHHYTIDDSGDAYQDD